MFFALAKQRMHRFLCGLSFMIGLSSWYQDLKAFNVSSVSFFFNLNILDPNWFLIDTHIAEKHFLITVWVVWMIIVETAQCETDPFKPPTYIQYS